jgi:hypothetical protein
LATDLLRRKVTVIIAAPTPVAFAARSGHCPADWGVLLERNVNAPITNHESSGEHLASVSIVALSCSHPGDAKQ